MTATLLQSSREHLLDPYGLTVQDMQTVLDKAITYKSDYADLFLQANWSESWSLEQGVIKHASFEEDADLVCALYG